MSGAKKIDMETLIIRGQGNTTILCLDGKRVRVFVDNLYYSYEENDFYGSVSGMCKVPKTRDRKDCAEIQWEFRITEAQSPRVEIVKDKV